MSNTIKAPTRSQECPLNFVEEILKFGDDYGIKDCASKEPLTGSFPPLPITHYRNFKLSYLCINYFHLVTWYASFGVFPS